MPSLNKQKRALKQLNYLKKLVNKERVRLAAEWPKPWQVLISTILSAQTKDETTIKVSEELYKKYKNVRALAEAPLLDIQKIIKPVNYYKTKARNIKETAKIISKNGLPKTRLELMKLPGVGYKVSNVYLAVAHRKQCIGVDTHVARISYSLGWSKHKNPYKIEKDLEKLFSKRYWRLINYVLVKFGRVYGKNREKEREILSIIKKL